MSKIEYDGISSVNKIKKAVLIILLLISWAGLTYLFYEFGYLYLKSFLNEHIDVFDKISFCIYLSLCCFFLRYKKDSNLWANLILGIGTLGTFIGIFFTFKDLSIDVNSIEQLILSIKNVINSLKFVFATSILGIGTSIALRATKGFISLFINNDKYEKNVEKYLLSSINTLISNTKKLSEFLEGKDKKDTEKADKIFVEISKIYENLENSINFFVEETYKKIIDGIYNNIADKLGEDFMQFNNGIRNITEYFDRHKNIVELLKDMYEKSREHQIEFSNVLDNLNKNIKFQDNFIKELNDKFNSFTASVETQKNLFENFNINIDKIKQNGESLTEFLDTFKEHQEKFKNDCINNQIDLNNFIKQLTDQADNNFNTFITVSKEMEKQMTNLLNNILIGITTQQDNLKNIFTDNQINLANILKEQTDNLIQKEFKTLQQIVEINGESLTEFLDTFKEQQEKFKNDFINNQIDLNNFIKKLTDQADNNFNTFITISKEKEEQVTNLLNNILIGITTQQNNLKNIFTNNQINLADTLKELTDSLIQKEFKTLQQIVEINSKEFKQLLESMISKYIETIIRTKEFVQNINENVIETNISSENNLSKEG